MGFKKTVIYGAKCDKCGKELLFRIENATQYDNPTKTSTKSLLQREGWKIGKHMYICNCCAESGKAERND